MARVYATPTMLLAAALTFVLLAVLADLGGERPWVLAIAILVAAWLGTTLPDLDLPLGLGHRSGLTHSVLPALAVGSRRRWRAVGAGLALGLALHLSADVFPNAMRGYARVILPGVGRFGARASYAWLAVNAAAALAAGVWLVRRSHPPRVALATLATTAMIGLAYLFRTDGGWWVLALLVAPALLVACRRYGRSSA